MLKTMVVFLSPGGSILLKSARKKWIRLSGFDVGDAIVLDGNVHHAGDYYTENNYRLHWYLMPPDGKPRNSVRHNYGGELVSCIEAEFVVNFRNLAKKHTDGKKKMV